MYTRALRIYTDALGERHSRVLECEHILRLCKEKMVCILRKYDRNMQCVWFSGELKKSGMRLWLDFEFFSRQYCI